MSPPESIDILLVEDNADDALLLQLLLRRAGEAGVQIRCVHTLAQARVALAERWPDVALLDLTLPDSLGEVDALKSLRTWAPTLPIVVCSGMDSPTLVSQVKAAGAQGFFSKGNLDAVALMREVRSAITRCRRLLDEMRTNAESFFDVVERSGDGILVLQGERIRYANPRAAVMFSRSREILLEGGQPWPPTTASPFEVSIFREDGASGVGEIRLSEVSWEGQAACLAVVRDVSRSRAAEKALREQEQHLEWARRMEAVGLLAGGVAHEFNNQLMVIQGFTELVQHTLDQPARAHSHLQRVIDAAQRAADITRQLMSLARRPSPPSQPSPLSPLLYEARHLLAPLLGETIQLQIVVSPAVAGIQARFTPGEVQQVLMNLAINARDAMPQGGLLELGLSLAEREELPARVVADETRWMRLWVRDTGVGMDEATQARAFEPFFTTKEVGAGTGLGLSTVYGLTQRWQGHLHLKSAPGEGTTVSIFIPGESVASPGVLPAAGARVPVDVLQNTETILVVEDELQIRDYLRVALSRRGFRVCTAADPREALALLTRQDVDAMVLDVVMPGMTGPALVEELRARGATMRVVYISGYPHRQATAQIILAPHVAFLQKPVQEEALVRALRQVLMAPLPGPA